MLIIQICVGSSCHIKGSQDIVELLQAAIAEHHLEDDVVLTGSFCAGKCNRIGVTVQVNDEVYAGITRDNFSDFFKTHVLDVVMSERK